MTTRSHAEICEILDDNGPDLLERIELSERFYQCLTSEKVIQDRTLIRDLKVGENMAKTTKVPVSCVVKYGFILVPQSRLRSCSQPYTVRATSGPNPVLSLVSWDQGPVLFGHLTGGRSWGFQAQ